MRRVMVVDDEAIITTQLEERLTYMGYNVIGGASSGEEAIDMARRYSPDVILMDIVMPGRLDGIDATATINRELDIPVIFLTAYADDKFIKRARNVEPFGYIIKPFNDREIKAAIEIALYKKIIEQKIKASLKEKEVLLQEIHHRVKNNLQAILSMLNLQKAYIKNGQMYKILKNYQDRIGTMILVHDRLHQSKDLANIKASEYIRALTHNLFLSYGVTGKIKLKLKIEEVNLGINFAIPCGLILNELITNSMEHAFPKGKKGEINIKLCSINEGEVELVVGDDGVGIPADLDFKNTKSFGLRLVNILVDQLEGEIKLDRTGGTKFQIKFRVVK